MLCPHVRLDLDMSFEILKKVQSPKSIFDGWRLTKEDTTALTIPRSLRDWRERHGGRIGNSPKKAKRKCGYGLWAFKNTRCYFKTKQNAFFDVTIFAAKCHGNLPNFIVPTNIGGRPNHLVVLPIPPPRTPIHILQCHLLLLLLPDIQ